MELKVIDYIKNNKDWLEKLSQPPFSLTIKEDANYYLLKYNQYMSDFSNKIVQECRGLIIDKATLSPKGLSYKKFFNYGEPEAATIDWNNCKVYDKIDGSKIMVWWDNVWHVSTSGNIDAYTTYTTDGSHSFGELFNKAILNHYISIRDFYKDLNINHCYTFELVSPDAPIIIKYDTTDVYLIGIRDMQILDEIDISADEAWTISRPARYNITSLEDCINAANVLNHNQSGVVYEGFVICDKDYNRIKIKDPKYLTCHYLYGNGIITTYKLLQIIESNEIDEVCAYFPEWKQKLDNIAKAKEKVLNFYASVKLDVLQFICKNNINLVYNTTINKIQIDLSKKKEFVLYLQSIYIGYKTAFRFGIEISKNINITPEEFWQNLSKDIKVELIEHNLKRA